MFFSYNNGISTTASNVELKPKGRTLYITKLTDWQIVNGGQTTASIASAQGCDLSKVFVQMKVSVVKNKENERNITKVNQAENAIALKKKAETLGFSYES